MKVETKYEIGEELYAIRNGKPKKRRVNRIEIKAYKNGILIFYSFDGELNDYNEEDVYRTKEELLNYLKQWE
jgi:hypothetical protein